MKVSSFRVVRNVLLKCKGNKFWSAHHILFYFSFEAFCKWEEAPKEIHFTPMQIFPLGTYFVTWFFFYPRKKKPAGNLFGNIL